MKKIAVLGCAFLLAGCVFGTSEPSVFYTLRAETGQVAVSKTRASVGVVEVGVPGTIGNPQIVLNGEQTMQLDVSETNRWGEPLSTLFQRTLVNDMIGYLPNAFVKPKTYSSEQFKYTVLVDIDQMTGTLGGDAVLSVWWQINNRSGYRLAREYHVFTAPAGDTYESYVAAQSRLVNELAKRIATKVGK